MERIEKAERLEFLGQYTNFDLYGMYHIDDSVENVVQIAENGVKVINVYTGRIKEINSE
jgi:nucleoside-diphosphate-sugar epimerase